MDNNPGQDFLNKTKYPHTSPSDQDKKLPDPPLEVSYDHEAETIQLPIPKELSVPAMDLRHAIEQRRSIRKYSVTPLSIEELSYLLWTTQGVQTIFKGRVTLRTVPSAGARHAFETVVLVNKVEHIPQGLYRYSALDHKLISLPCSKDISRLITNACLKQKIVLTSAATFIWIAVPYRMNWRYSERGYRYLFLDAGHVGQNFYLAAESMDCGACTIAAYKDDELNSLLDLDGEEMFVIYLGTVGKKEEE